MLIGFEEKNADTLLMHQDYDCLIDLQPRAKIPLGQIYAMSELELAALCEYLQGFIRKSTLLAGASVLFVIKTDRSLRLCVAYRALSQITVLKRYPLPFILKLLDCLRAARFSTKLDHSMATSTIWLCHSV